jgi:hypothetical protein
MLDIIDRRRINNKPKKSKFALEFENKIDQEELDGFKNYKVIFLLKINLVELHSADLQRKRTRG